MASISPRISITLRARVAPPERVLPDREGAGDAQEALAGHEGDRGQVGGDPARDGGDRGFVDPRLAGRQGQRRGR